MSNMDSFKGRIVGFDGLRGIAAVSVVATHLHIFKWLENHGLASNGIVASIDGNAAVQAFFVLSGFLITRLLLIEAEVKLNISIKNFYIRRALRILPLYFLVIFLVLIFHWVGNRVTKDVSLIYASVFMTNFIPKSDYSSILGHTWSLAVEEHFYLIWPFVFILFVKKLHRLFYFTLAAVVVSYFFSKYLLSLTELAEEYFVARWTFVAGSSIALGCLLALYIERTENDLMFRKLWGLALSLLLIFNQGMIELSDNLSSYYLRGVGFAIFIAWLAQNQHSFIAKLLDIAPLRYLGKVSYGIYMYQGFFLATGPYRHPEQTWPPQHSVGILCLLLIVPISYHLFEKPILKLKQKYKV